MLRTIPRNLTPQLMKALLQMGHGDEIVFGDANFPAASVGRRVIHMEAESAVNLLKSLLPLFPLDNFVKENVVLMSVVPGKGEAPKVWARYRQMICENDREGAFSDFTYLNREEFYARARSAFVVVATGETEKYGNIILKLGVVEQ